MKGLKIFVVILLAIVGANTVVNAQKHRHSERNDSTEAAILSAAVDEWEDDMPEIGDFEASIEDFSDKMERKMDKFVRKLDENKHSDYDDDSLLLSLFKGIIAFGVIAFVFIILALVFGAPFVILGVFIWFIVWLCKPNKKKEQPAAPLAQPVDVAEVKKERKEQTETMLQKAIKEIFIGAGFYAVSLIISSKFFAAIGVFKIIYGSGRCLIAKITNKRNEKPE